MPEIKNTFTKSKMNKDLDDRLLSNGEYRNAQNVNISRSEGDDVGALENVLGNTLVANLPSSQSGLEVIGYLEDDGNNRAFFFVTDYTDTSLDMLSNVAPYNSLHYIIMRDLTNNTTNTLVTGRFLNFSKTSPVFGVNLIENLLFFTDNRNQPRKINVDKAIDSQDHYNSEDQISVAKYYPYEPIKLYNNISISSVSGSGTTYTTTTVLTRDNCRANMNIAGTAAYVQTVKYTSPYQFTTTSTIGSKNESTIQLIEKSAQNANDEFLPPSIIVVGLGSTAFVSTTSCKFPVGNSSSTIKTTMRFNAIGYTDPNNLPTVTAITTAGGYETLQLSGAHGIPNNLSGFAAVVAELSWPNPDYINTFPGDNDFLKDKFSRFAYRFKFEDGEYSLISPFTQPVFIPFQDGYISDRAVENFNSAGTLIPKQEFGETAIMASTILPFFENSVNSIQLNVPSPYNWSALEPNLKVIELDILYKESDGLAIQVLETIDSSVFSKNPDGSDNDTKNFIYNYQSRKPFRTLPANETTRVFDKVPIRALSQSSVGNRIVYGNFVNKHTPPENLDYNVQIFQKATSVNPTSAASGDIYNNSCISYPTHTVKQNRTYQIGIVLADRYGRQSDVILSSITDFQQSQDGGTTVYDGSTIYHPYKSKLSNNPQNWKGDAIRLLMRNAIPSTASYAEGYPGLYQAPTIIGTFTVNNSGTQYTVGTISNYQVGDIIQVPTGDAGRVITSITSVNTTTSRITIADEITNQATASYNVTIFKDENKLGWYSYKIVVKQQAGDYYNAYVGNISTISTSSAIVSNDGGTTDSGGYTFSQNSFVTSLISDNVNKIPADLNAVGPEQTQFGTSDVELYPRVGSTTSLISTVYVPTQFYFGTTTASINAYGKITDIGLAELDSNGTRKTPVQSEGVYAAASDPPAIILTMPDGQIIGKSGDKNVALGIFEIKPAESRLEIFWETSTSGLISDLNNAVAIGSTASPVAPDPPVTPVSE